MTIPRGGTTSGPALMAGDGVRTLSGVQCGVSFPFLAQTNVRDEQFRRDAQINLTEVFQPGKHYVISAD
jgi:hypothetical protein